MTKQNRFGVSALVAGTLIAGLIAGCGGSSKPATPLNYVKVEQGIATSILQQHHIYTLVACPHRIPQQVGYRFSCTAELTAGRYPLKVTEGKASRVSWVGTTPLVVLDVQRVEQAIVASLKHQRHLAATANCPSSVLQQAHLTFTCTAKVGTHTTPFKVTETDGDGHVTFVGV
jgi:hypothetical protein